MSRSPRCHVKPGMTVNELVEAMGRAGPTTAGRCTGRPIFTSRCCGTRRQRSSSGLPGAMVPAGMGGIVSDLIRAKHIDVLVSTGANLTHDIIEAIGCHHFHGTAFCNDIELRHDEINRIYDVYLPNDAFEHFEAFMQEVFGETRARQHDLHLRPARTYREEDKVRHPAHRGPEPYPGLLPCRAGLDDRPPGTGSSPRRTR